VSGHPKEFLEARTAQQGRVGGNRSSGRRHGDELWEVKKGKIKKTENVLPYRVALNTIFSKAAQFVDRSISSTTESTVKQAADDRHAASSNLRDEAASKTAEGEEPWLMDTVDTKEQGGAMTLDVVGRCNRHIVDDDVENALRFPDDIWDLSLMERLDLGAKWVSELRSGCVITVDDEKQVINQGTININKFMAES
jgi:hypothetical protein